MKKSILWGWALIFLSLPCFAQTFQWANSEPCNSFVTWTNKIIHDKSGNTFISGNDGQYANSIFIVKYDSSGNKLWKKNYSGYASIPSLCSDNSGNLYVIIFVDGPHIIIDGQQYDNTNGYYLNLFIKYDPAGNILWIKQQNNLAMMLSERTDQQDNLIVTGNINGTVYLDNNITLSTTSGYGTNFLAKFNTNGECIWAQENDGGGYPLFCNSMGEMFALGEIDTVITVGQGNNQVTLYPTNGAGYIAKYKPNGDLVWVKQIGTSLIAADEFGNAYTMEYDTNFPNTGFITKYNSMGNLLWKRTSIYVDKWYKGQMKCGSNGNLYFSGGFTNYMTIDGNTYNDGGNTRAFVAKIDSSGTLKWISISSGAGGAGAKDITIANSNEIYITGDMGGGENIFGAHSVTQSQGVFVSKIIDNENTAAINNLAVSDNALSVYPNPSNTIFTISYKSTNASNLNFTITNANGKLIYSDNQKQFSGQYLTTIDLSGQAKGVYFIEMICGKQKESKKIVLQ